MRVDLASCATAQRVPDAWIGVLDVGHFVWVEPPGTGRHALDRLANSI